MAVQVVVGSLNDMATPQRLRGLRDRPHKSRDELQSGRRGGAAT